MLGADIERSLQSLEVFECCRSDLKRRGVKRCILRLSPKIRLLVLLGFQGLRKQKRRASARRFISA